MDQQHNRFKLACWTTASLEHFGANRVSNNQETLPRKNWDYVPTNENPADVASRGTTVSELLDNALWWKGPSWLSDDIEKWPHYRPTNEEIPEKREPKQVLTVTSEPPLLEISRFSSFTKLCRVLAVIRRFLAALKKDGKCLQEPTSPHEISSASNDLISMEQRRFQKQDFNFLMQQKELSKFSKLRNLCPFYDPHANALWVGGRLGNSNLNELKKFPLLIPKESSLVPLIVPHFHEETLYGGGATNSLCY